MRSNSTLKCLGLGWPPLGSRRITAKGWSLFEKLLCDKSNIKNTYLSNHTVYLTPEESFLEEPIWFYSLLNRGTDDKRRVAIAKIVTHHSHFNVQPLFEWELKVLPLMVEFFKKAFTFSFSYFGETKIIKRKKIKKMRLSVIYDFIKEFPMLYIEPVTRKEIAECTVLEEELMNQSSVCDKDSRLEEIRRHKARAMRRLQ